MNEKPNALTGDASELMGLLERGHGRAVLFLRNKYTVAFRDVILHACLHNLCYDQQMESRRDEYLYDVIKATHEPYFYAPFIREALFNSIDEKDVYQLVGLTLQLAKHEDLDARAALYQFVTEQPLRQGDLLGAVELIELDGLEGFSYVVHHQPARSDDDPCYWHASWYLERLEERIGTDEYDAVVRHLTDTDPVCAKFIREATDYREAHKGHRPPPFPLPEFDEFVRLLSSTDRRLYPMRWTVWGREAGKRYAKKVGRLLEREIDPLRLLRLLRFFDDCPFPGDPSVILEQVENPDEKIARAAKDALANVTDPRVRELALSLVRFSREPDFGVQMLASNYQDGDDLLILSALTRDLSAYEFHNLSMDAFSSRKTLPWSHNRAVLLLIYERVHCSSCRGDAVEQLMEFGPLPEWMVDECRYDASLDLRRLVGA